MIARDRQTGQGLACADCFFKSDIACAGVDRQWRGVDGGFANVVVQQIGSTACTVVKQIVPVAVGASELRSVFTAVIQSVERAGTAVVRFTRRPVGIGERLPRFGAGGPAPSAIALASSTNPGRGVISRQRRQRVFQP